MAKSWYAVYTKARKEDSVAKLVSNAGVSVFLPKLKLKRLHKGNHREVIEPLFPCYIFALFLYPEEYSLVKYARGVRRVVGTPREPIPVDEKIISVIDARLINGVAEIKPPDFKKGDRVGIVTGPFHGLMGIFEKEIPGKKRALILLDTILQVRVEIDKEALTKDCLI